MRTGEIKIRGPELSLVGNSMPFLVQVSVTVPPIPSCGNTEQVSLRDCPASIKLLKGFILTVGGEGTAVKKLAHNNVFLDDYVTHNQQSLRQFYLPLH